LHDIKEQLLLKEIEEESKMASKKKLKNLKKVLDKQKSM